MSLAPGTRLGPYDIVSPIGAGGMGEVYRARDSKLNRDVAIKVLPEVFAADADRLARFTREAQVLASLNHPNIAAIYGIEQNALVMELVEGHDLSTLIAGSAGSGGLALHLNDILAIAAQIADALEAAHEQGIVHRDLKPANIKVRADGTVKVLDFGLAKAMDPSSGSNADAMNSPTMTARATQMGMIIGTAAYMAPEQARGRAVDRRADIWAFGVVLYEMLSGRRAFEGDDISITLANVLKDDLAWDALPKDLPAPLHRLLRRCLEKDPKRRLSWIGEARLALTEPASAASGATSVAVVAPPPTSSPAWKVAAALLTLTTLAGVAAWYRARAVVPASASFLVAAPDKTTFVTGATGRLGAVPAISPDGRLLTFTAADESGKRMLWVRPIASVTAQPLAGTEGAGWPFWSPDSRYIAYSANSKLMKIAATGGPSFTIGALGPNISARGGTWSRDGVIVLNNGPGPLHRVSSSGGSVTPIGELAAGEGGRQFPWFLPDGHHVLYSGGAGAAAGVWVTSLDTGESKRLVGSETGAVYDVQNRYLLFGQQGTLMAQAFDPKTLALSGDAFPIAERLETAAVPGVVAFSVSETGTMAYGTGAAADSGFELVWVDRQGRRLGTVGPTGNYFGIDLSPDGTQLAAHRHEGDGGDIWLTDLTRGTTSRFTLNAAQDNASPVWSPNSKQLAYASVRSGKAGVYVKNADNTGDELRLWETEVASGAGGPQPHSWSTDGRAVLFSRVTGTATLGDLSMLPVFGDRKPVPLLTAPYAERLGQLSPDGRWLAYVSSETGGLEVYIQPASGSGGKWPVSTAGGSNPRWRGDSRELFFMSAAKIMAVEIMANAAGLKTGATTPLFDSGNFGGRHADNFPYAVTRDGQRFLIARPASNAAGPVSSPIVVVLNWIEGIRK